MSIREALRLTAERLKEAHLEEWKTLKYGQFSTRLERIRVYLTLNCLKPAIFNTECEYSQDLGQGETFSSLIEKGLFLISLDDGKGFPIFHFATLLVRHEP